MTAPIPPGPPQPGQPQPPFAPNPQQPPGAGGFSPPPGAGPYSPAPGFQPGYQPGYPVGPGYPPGHQMGPGPGAYPQPPPKSGSGKGCLIAFLVVLALVIVAAVVIAIFFSTLFKGIFDFSQAVVENATEVGEPAGGIGDTVEVEGTQFVVRSFECGASTAASPDTDEFPVAPPTSNSTDELCIASVTAKNVSDQPMLFTGTEAQAFLDKGSEPIQSMPRFDADTVGNLGVVDPGRSTEVEYMFGVPKGTHPKYLKLHAGTADPTQNPDAFLPGLLGPGVTVTVG